MGFLKRLRDHLTRSSDDFDADELSTQSIQVGADPIAGLQDRGLANALGVVRNLTVPPHGQVPALTAELYDGTGTLTLVWLGRREIPGIVCGVRMRARGRVTMNKGRMTMFNPRYELLPPSGARQQ